MRSKGLAVESREPGNWRMEVWSIVEGVQRWALVSIIIIIINVSSGLPLTERPCSSRWYLSMFAPPPFKAIAYPSQALVMESLHMRTHANVAQIA